MDGLLFLTKETQKEIGNYIILRSPAIREAWRAQNTWT